MRAPRDLPSSNSKNLKRPKQGLLEELLEVLPPRRKKPNQQHPKKKRKSQLDPGDQVALNQNLQSNQVASLVVVP